MSTSALDRRGLAAFCIAALLLAGCGATPPYASFQASTDPQLEPVLDMAKAEVRQKLEPWVLAGNVTWYDGALQQVAFGDIPSSARCTLQSPLAEWLDASGEWKRLPTSTPIRVVMSQTLATPDFRGMTVQAARDRAAAVGLTLEFFRDGQPDPDPDPQAIVQNNVSANPPFTKIQVGGTVGLVIVGLGQLEAGGSDD
jgi:hypothetical protein